MTQMTGLRGDGKGDLCSLAPCDIPMLFGISSGLAAVFSGTAILDRDCFAE